jgi:2,3-dimethylmalate lyase
VAIDASSLNEPELLCHGCARRSKHGHGDRHPRDPAARGDGRLGRALGQARRRRGLDAVFVSGYCLSATRLGAPDLGLVTQTEVLDAAARVTAAVDVPVIVDIDTGYGDAFNVERTVRELVRLGAAGCFLEDQAWPKRCGHMEGKQVVDLDTYLPKLAAARAARGDAPFHVTARTDARAVHGLDEAIRRARAFADAGADAVFVEAPESIAEMDAVRAAIPAAVPLVANMVEHGKTPLRSAAELAAAGYAIIVMPVTGILAAARAMRDAYAALAAAGTSEPVRDRLMRFDELNDFLGLGERYRREGRA